MLSLASGVMVDGRIERGEPFSKFLSQLPLFLQSTGRIVSTLMNRLREYYTPA
jgi:hypothetical protein